MTRAVHLQLRMLFAEFAPEARGVYAGATRYLPFGGDLDACITIQTLFVRGRPEGREVSVSAGAGIVADSQRELEEKETVNNGVALFAAVGLGEVLEASA